MEQPKFKRVLLKISGEALAGEASRGLDFKVIGQVCDAVKRCVELGVQVGVVVGGGNFWRGVKDGGGAMERVRVEVRVQTAIAMQAVAEPYIRSKAIRHLEKGRVVIFGCGTGNPFFSTDTAAVLRAAEIDADVILLAKNIDASTPPTPRRTPTPPNTAKSATTRCWPSIWR